MKSALLNCTSFVPPLLESQITAPYWMVQKHLQYLQKWREYLCWYYCEGQYDLSSSAEIQKVIDDFIQTVLLLEIAGQYDAVEIPSFAGVFAGVSHIDSSRVAKEIQRSLPSKLLQEAFESDLHFPSVEIWFEEHVKPLVDISESARTFYNGRIPTTLLADFHQLCLDIPVAPPVGSLKSNCRRRKGVYYTPAAVVDYLTQQVMKRAFGEKDIKQISKAKILDPSCGYGCFLVASYRYMLERLGEHCQRHPDVSFEEEAMNLLRSTIRGTDVDETAVSWTRKLLFFTAWQACLVYGTSRNSGPELPIPDMSGNILCHDFLDTTQDTFSDTSEPFDIVIGGPPFVRTADLSRQDPKAVERYKQTFTVASGQFDLYMLFIERAIELMGHNGLLGMTVSNSFMRSGCGRKLRELISQTCSVEEIVEFEDKRLYPNASVSIALILLRKTHLRTPTTYILVKGRGGLRRRLTNMGSHRDDILTHRVDTRQGDHRTWILKGASYPEDLQTIECVGTQIQDLPVDVHFGIATGADRAFMLRDAGSLTHETLLAESRFLDGIFEFERAILRPILRGRDIGGYATPGSETFCVCPYDQEGVILSESTLKKHYPRAYRYLQTCRDILESRHRKDNVPWYGFKTNRISRSLHSPKLISSGVSSGASFTLEEKNLLCSSGVLVVRPRTRDIDPYCLLAILNSSLFRKWADYNMPSLGNGWRSFRIGTIRKFPIVLRNDENQAIVREIVERARSLMLQDWGTEDDDRTLQELDEKVCLLYNISESRFSPG